MILIIDNYDSFTYNLVQRLGELDGRLAIEVFRNDKIAPERVARGNLRLPALVHVLSSAGARLAARVFALDLQPLETRDVDRLKRQAVAHRDRTFSTTAAMVASSPRLPVP